MGEDTKDVSELTNAEINQRIHETILGKCWHDIEQVPNGLGGSYICKKCKFGEHQLYLSGEIWNPDYCSKIEYAWKVIDKLRADGWLCVVKDMPDGFPYVAGNEEDAPKIYRRSCADFKYMLRYTENSVIKYMHSLIFTVADSPAKAICLAALKVDDNLQKEKKRRELCSQNLHNAIK